MIGRLKLFAILLSFCCFSLNSAAQVDIDWKAGAGLAFGTGAETVGFRLQGNAQVTEQWEGVANFIIYFKNDINYWEFNLDGHYDFAVTNDITVYPMAGFNISRIGYSGVNVPGVGNFGGGGDTRVGLNVGGGGEYAFTDQWAAFAEIKYIISNFDQLVISLGALFSF